MPYSRADALFAGADAPGMSACTALRSSALNTLAVKTIAVKTFVVKILAVKTLCLFAVCLAIAGFAGRASAQTTVLATPSSLAFGDVELNSIRQASVQIAVIGDAQFQRYELDTAAFGADGPFTLSNVDCPVAGGSGAVTEPCSLSIRFAPTRSGPAAFSRDLTYTVIYSSTRQVLGTVRVAANGRGVGDDADSDGVYDDRDECANTPRSERADERGCAPSQRDTDSDEVTDDRDECANTPRGERADERGCGPSQRDTDSDEVTDDRDECANTPRGERADERGCGPSQRDTDSDEVTDDRDECANTPAGERADERGCGPSQRDTDSDEVSDDRDECANTPAGEQADERGCGPSQRDSDDDEVNDDRDECPNTPRGARVDSSGCPLGDDADDDGVSDDRDDCANTPAGEQADERGCGPSQRDFDDDGVNDADDRCPNVAGSGEDGCPNEDEDEDELRDDLTPFTGNDPTLNQTRDVIADSCTSQRASEALQEACEELSQAAASDDTSGVAEALREITPEKATKGNVAVRQNNRVQNRNLGDRMIALRSGVRGVSLRGLTASLGDYRGSVEDIVQMIADALGPLGGGAGELEDTLLSGSRWGYFLSGELSKGDKDETARTSGFDFENRVITTGIDYRLRDNLILGAAVSFLDGENDIDRDGGSLDSDGHAFSLYGTWYRENLFVDLSVSLGAMEYEQSRRIVYQLGTRASVDNRFDAKYDGDSLGVFAGFGWNLIRKQWNINLRATFDYLDSDLDAFTETARSTAGAGWAVFLDKQNQSWLTGTATATASYVFTPRWGVMIPFIEVDLVHEFDNDPQALSGRFLGDLQGESLSVLTDDPDRNYVRVRAGASVQLPGGFAAFADYGRLLAFDNWGEHTISAGIRYEF